VRGCLKKLRACGKALTRIAFGDPTSPGTGEVK